MFWFLTVAFAGPAAIPLGGEVSEAQQLEVRRTVYRPDLEFLDAGTLTEDGLEQALREDIDACEPSITEDQRGEIFDIADEQGDEIYLVLADREPLIWRFDRELNTLFRVVIDAPPPQIEGPATLLLLPWGSVPKLKRKQLKAVGVTSSETLPLDEDLITALMRHPSECTTHLGETALDKVASYVEGREGTVLFGVLAEKDLLVWTWDPDERALHR